MIEWILAGMSILGAILNTKMNRNGFLLWIAANSGWIVVNVKIGLYAQIPMWVVMTVIAVYGYVSWSKEKGKSYEWWGPGTL